MSTPFVQYSCDARGAWNDYVKTIQSELLNVVPVCEAKVTPELIHSVSH